MGIKKVHYILIGDYGYDEQTIRDTHVKAKNFFNSKVNLVSNIQRTNPIGYFFFIKCDGHYSKWSKPSDYMESRSKMLGYLIENEIKFLELSEQKVNMILQGSKNGREIAKPLFLV